MPWKLDFKPCALKFQPASKPSLPFNTMPLDGAPRPGIGIMINSIALLFLLGIATPQEKANKDFEEHLSPTGSAKR